MNKKLKTALLLLLFAAFLAAAGLAYQRLSQDVAPEQPAPPEQQAETEDQPAIPAPDFVMEDGSGNTYNLTDFQGQPVVVNFWASWCPACVLEMPDFNTAYAEYGDQVAFIMLDAVDGQRETKETGAAYVAEQGYTFPVYFDMDFKAGETYTVMYLPSTIFIDAEGNIFKGVRGAVSADTLRDTLDALLAAGE